MNREYREKYLKVQKIGILIKEILKQLNLSKIKFLSERYTIYNF